LTEQKWDEIIKVQDEWNKVEMLAE